MPDCLLSARSHHTICDVRSSQDWFYAPDSRKTIRNWELAPVALLETLSIVDCRTGSFNSSFSEIVYDDLW